MKGYGMSKRRARSSSFAVEGRIDGAEGATVTIEPSGVRGGYLIHVRLKHRREVESIPLIDVVEIVTERAAKARARLAAR